MSSSSETKTKYVNTRGCGDVDIPRDKKIKVSKEVVEYKVTEEDLELFKSVPGYNSNPALYKTKYFDVEYTTITDDDSGEVIDKQTNVTFEYNQLSQVLKYSGMNSEKLYDTRPTLSATELISYMPQIKQQIPNYSNGYNQQSMITCQSIRALLRFLDNEYSWLTERIEQMIQEGKIGFDHLWYIFQKDVKFYGYEEQEKVGAVVVTSKYQQTMFSRMFVVTGTVIMTDGRKFMTQDKNFVIHAFDGIIDMKKLNLQPLDNATLEELTNRGRLFEKVGLGAHYMNYKGNIVRKHWFYTNLFKADGRLMVDEVSFKRMNPNYGGGGYNHYNHGATDEGIKEIPEERLFQTWPYIKGFSFAVKKWGEAAVSKLSEVVFDDKAFDRLVLPTEKKKLIRSLVVHTHKTFSDIITGKGGGCIFLLHGNPGVGKTLTAEAVSEMLHRPLYSVTVGELGVNTQDLESRLREILEVASTWKAVILIDEADIFLEKRSEKDIQRNAMVGIFLRLLEYHQGILFLTTNRVKCFDEAFHSRISISIKYEDLHQEARQAIWTNFLEMAGIKNLDASKLSAYDLNGRQIRSTIRLAQALALSEKAQVSEEHINRCVKISSQFETELQ